MDRLIATNSVPLSGADIAPATGTPQYATNGNPATGIPATQMPAYAFNALQEELMSVLAAGGVTPDRTNNGQVALAIENLINGMAGKVVNSMGALRALPKTGAQNVFVTGYRNDGTYQGGGKYTFSSSDTTSGAFFVGFISGNILTVSSVTNGAITIGQQINYSGSDGSVYIIAGSGTSWTINQSLTIPSNTMTADNGGTIIVASDGGRWYLLRSGPLTPYLFGAKGDGITDDYYRLSAWLSAGGNYLQAGTFLHSQTIVLYNDREYYGDGKNNSVFKYSGVLDQAQINNPINSSTAANIGLRALSFVSVGGQMAGHANLVDTGSTYLHIQDCRFYGAMIQLILDQTEVSDFDRNEFLLGSNAASTGVWIVSGNRAGGGGANFTNRISFRGNQFNGSVGIGIVDDGGYAHAFQGNNFNGLVNHMRIAGVQALIIDGANELEAASAASIWLAATKSDGSAASPTNHLRYGNNFSVLGAQPALQIDAGALTSIDIIGNSFDCTSNAYVGLNNCSDVRAFGNTQWSAAGTGADYFHLNNYFETSAPCTWTASGTAPALGDGSLTTTTKRDGRRINQKITLTLGSTTTLGSGNWDFSTTFGTEVSPDANLGTILVTSGNYYSGVAKALNNYITGYFNGAAVGLGPSTPVAWGAGAILEIDITYNAVNQVG